MVFSLGVTAFGAYRKATATLEYNDIKIVVDGKTITPKTANGAVVEPFAIDGTTYLPVRAISTALDMGVDWDSSTKSVMITSQRNQQAEDMIKYYKMLEEGFSFLYEHFNDLSSDRISRYADTNTLIAGKTFGESMILASESKRMQMDAWYDHCYNAGYLSDEAIALMFNYRELNNTFISDVKILQQYQSSNNIISIKSSAGSSMWSASSYELTANSKFWAWYDDLTL